MIKAVMSKLVQNQNLTESEIINFVLGIRDDTVTDIQVAGFLMGLTMKGATTHEVAYIAKAMRSVCAQINPKVSGDLLDTCGTGGGLTTYNVSTANCIVAAAAGIPVAKHGSRSISSPSGSADALEALGVFIDMVPEQAKKLIEEIGICFMYAPNFHPVMGKVFGPENQLGIKTIFYTIIGPIINPADARRHILGVYKPELVSMVAEILVELDFRHAIVAHGLDGLDEISILGRTSIAEVKDGNIKKYEIAPEEFGIPRCTLEDVAGGNPETNARMIRDIFEGRDKGHRYNFLLLNSGAALYVGGVAESLKDGIERARQIIDSGDAARKLDEYIAKSNELKPKE